MPTPVGHSLMGYILYSERKKANWNLTWKDMFVFIFIANLADVDYIPGFFVGNPNHFHHGMTHSIGFAIFTGLIFGLFYYIKERENNLL